MKTETDQDKLAEPPRVGSVGGTIVLLGEPNPQMSIVGARELARRLNAVADQADRCVSTQARVVGH